MWKLNELIQAPDQLVKHQLFACTQEQKERRGFRHSLGPPPVTLTSFPLSLSLPHLLPLQQLSTGPNLAQLEGANLLQSLQHSAATQAGQKALSPQPCSQKAAPGQPPQAMPVTQLMQVAMPRWPSTACRHAESLV